MKKRVLVIGIYVSSSALRIHRRAMARAQDSFPRIHAFFQKKDVAFSDQGVVTHPATVRWVLETAGSALQ